MTNNWEKVIVHVDMDAFFAAVEQLINPTFRGKAVVVGALPKKGKGRGVVSTASYEARKFGIHSAMPISRAYRLCPEAIYVKPNGKIYSKYSKQIFEILTHFAPTLQKISVDEAFLDVTGSVHLFDSIEELGKKIKEMIFSETGLTASVGIAPSKSVAKIASDFQKPDGLTIIPQAKVQTFLDPLPVNRIWGVGNKTFETLTQMGIHTVRQLREYPLDNLELRFGKMGAHLNRMSMGIDERDVHDNDPIKSVSHETTFNQDQTDEDIIESNLLLLVEKVSSRLRKNRMCGKTIRLKLRFKDFSTFTRSKTISYYTNLTEDIFIITKSLYQQFSGKKKPVRLIGVAVSQLANESGRQTTIWDIENRRKLQLENVMDELQKKYGSSALTRAQTLTAKSGEKTNDK